MWGDRCLSFRCYIHLPVHRGYGKGPTWYLHSWSTSWDKSKGHRLTGLVQRARPTTSNDPTGTAKSRASAAGSTRRVSSEKGWPMGITRAQARTGNTARTTWIFHEYNVLFFRMGYDGTTYLPSGFRLAYCRVHLLPGEQVRVSRKRFEGPHRS